MYTMKDLANKYDTHINTIMRWCEDGHLEYSFNNNQIQFTDKQVQEFENKGRRKGYQVIK